jgi:predicted XRE-type DNA-binding protein
MQRATKVTTESYPNLSICYADGAVALVSLAPLIERGGVFAPLADPDFFAQASLAARGLAITWPGELDIDAAALRMPPSDLAANGHQLLALTPAAPDPIATLVAEVIGQSGLTQSEIARRMGTTQSGVARLASPDYTGHGIESLRRLAGAVGKRLLVRFEDEQSGR